METYGLEQLGIVNTAAVYRNLTPAQLTEHALIIRLLAALADPAKAPFFIIVVQKRAVPGAVQPQGALAQLRRPLPQTIQHHVARAMTRDGAREIVDVPRALRRKIRPARILVQQHRRGGDLAALIRYNKLRKFQNRRIENSPQNKGQGQRHLVE